MKDDTFFRGIRGPVGSGKSVSCCVEIFRRALAQKPNKQGIRRSRWAIIRNTNPQLKTTTIKTWLDWFPEDAWGKFTWSVPYTHMIKKGDLELEVLFLALDRPEDVKKLLSLELTGIWVNEAREIPKSIIDACTMRVGRFPSMRDGGATWTGVICDTNAPEEEASVVLPAVPIEASNAYCVAVQVLSTNKEIKATKATVANAAAISSKITAKAKSNSDFSLQASNVNNRFVDAIKIPAKNIALRTPDRITKRPPNNVKTTVVIQPRVFE